MYKVQYMFNGNRAEAKPLSQHRSFDAATKAAERYNRNALPGWGTRILNAGNCEISHIMSNKTRFMVSRFSPGDDIPDDPVYLKTEDQALQLAGAMAQPGALSSEPGDIITVYRVTTQHVVQYKRGEE